MQDERLSSAKLHATTVSISDHAVMIVGRSGSGKSALALQLMALGAVLIADDITELTKKPGGVWATAQAKAQPLIEARNVGLLRVDICPGAWLRLIVDLDQVETERLPAERATNVLSEVIPVVHNVEGAHFPAAIMHYVRGGKVDVGP